MYHNLLTKIKNAQAAGKSSLKTPYSGFGLAILETLVKNGFLSGLEVKGRSPHKKIIEISLKNDGGKRVIRGIKLISRPSRRIYLGYKEMKSVKSGHGMLVVSTPKGVISGKEARKSKVGGEALFEIW